MEYVLILTIFQPSGFNPLSAISQQVYYTKEACEAAAKAWKDQMKGSDCKALCVPRGF